MKSGSASMKPSPVHTANENGSSCTYEFDPRADFVQFLEEAKLHATSNELKDAPLLQPNWPQTRQETDAEKRRKKSWKSSLISWWKTNKKSKPVEESLNAQKMPKLKRGYVSGPIQRNLAEATVPRPRKPASGPLGILFSSTKRVENEMPYMCLDRLNNPHELHSYGPVYLVT